VKTAGIRRKILFIVLGVSFVSLAAFSGAARWGLYSIRARMQESSKRLGEDAAKNSREFLESEAIDKLVAKAGDRSKLVNERLLIISKDAAYFAQYASEIYRNAGRLPPVTVPYSSSKNSGKFAMQLKSANGAADYPRIRREAGLLGNITSAFVSNGSDMEEITVAVYIGTESGFEIIYSPFSDDANQTLDPRVRPWYVGAKGRGGMFWTDPYADASSGKRIVTCSHPFYGADGRLAGVAGIDVVLDDLNREVIDTDVGKNGYSFVVGADGILVASKELKTDANGFYEKKHVYRDNDPEYNNVINMMIAGKTGSARVNTDGGEMFVAFSHIPVTGWSLGIVLPVAEIMEVVTKNGAAIERMTSETLGFVDHTVKVALAFFALIFALAAVAIVYLSRTLSDRITRPIVTLEAGLERIAGGELDTVIELKTGDEIERLGGSVNSMTRKLKEYIGNLQRVTAENERIGAELNVATKIQASMLPCIFPPFPHRPEFDIYASMQPAKEVGGDFYDFFFVDERTLAVVMADVSGKGVPAALFMVIAKTLIKSNAQSGKSPGEVFESVNNILCENNDTGMFVTTFMGYLEIDTGKFSYVNAGHTPPILRAGGRVDYVRTKPGFVLAGMDGMKFSQGEITLRRGDELFLYTDGVTEAMNNEKALFGTARLMEAVRANAGGSLKAFAVSIKREIDRFAEGAEQADDITMLALRYVGVGINSAGGNGMNELSIEAKPENLGAVLDFIAGQLQAVDCPDRTRRQIAIAIEEIFVNIASYAYDPGAGGAGAVIRVSVGEDVAIEFEDGGRPYNPLDKEAPDVAASLENREAGGLGIFMVKHMMDAVDYRREGNRNILTVRKKLL